MHPRQLEVRPRCRLHCDCEGRLCLQVAVCLLLPRQLEAYMRGIEFVGVDLDSDGFFQWRLPRPRWLRRHDGRVRGKMASNASLLMVHPYLLHFCRVRAGVAEMQLIFADFTLLILFNWLFRRLRFGCWRRVVFGILITFGSRTSGSRVH